MEPAQRRYQSAYDSSAVENRLGLVVAVVRSQTNKLKQAAERCGVL